MNRKIDYRTFTLHKIVKNDMEEYFGYLILDDDSFIVNKKMRVEQDRFDRVYLDAELIVN